MAEHMNYDAAESKAKVQLQEEKETDSLFRSNDPRGSESLYASVMKDMKDLRAAGGSFVDSAETTLAKKFHSFNNSDSDENRILGGFELTQSGKDLKADRHHDSAAEKSPHSDDRVTASTRSFLNKVDQEAYSSPDAAYLSVANKLADNPRLLNMVTGSEGEVNTQTVDRALKIDAGASILAEKSSTPAPQELTAPEREALVDVRTHIATAMMQAFQIAGVLDPATAAGVRATLASAGIAAASVEGMTSKNIERALVDLNIDPQKADIAKTVGAMLGGHAATLLAGQIKDQGLTFAKPQDASATTQGDKQAASPPEKQASPRENVPQLADSEFPAVAKQVLAKLDTNHTGQITREQLVKALEDPSIKGKEAQALAALYHSFDSLHNLSHHEGMLSSKSITAADMDKYAEIRISQVQRVQDAYDMKTWAHNNLSKFDTNHNGSLTKGEIASALKDPKTSAADRKTLETIQKHYSEMGHMWESGVNLKAFDDFAANINKDTDNAKLVGAIWGSCYNVNKGQHSDISHDLYADSKNPLASINAEAIKQGTIGDCYFVSSLAAVAQAHPEMIKNAIKDNGDGTYTVTFPGARDNPITIKAPTEAEQGLYNHGSPNGLWASVIEKAYGAYCQQHFWRRGPFNLGGGNTPEEGADGGGRTAGAMKLLTGSDVSTNTTTFTWQSTMATNLEKAFSSHPAKAVTAGINGALPFTGEQTADNFYKGHAYTITNFVADGKGGGMITIRNPWGGTNGTTDGTITIPLDKFMKNFSDVSIEQ